MKRVLKIILWFAVFFGASEAFGGIIPAHASDEASHSHLPGISTGCQTPNLRYLQNDDENRPVHLWNEASFYSYRTITLDFHADSKKIIRLPSDPDSTFLFLYALGSLGTLQVGRTASKIDLEHAPERFGAGGRKQIECEEALESFHNPVPACLFEQLQDQRFFGYGYPEPLNYKINCGQFILVLNPRGPPHFTGNYFSLSTERYL